jgi:hypothetical protein
MARHDTHGTEFLKWALWRYARFMQLKADHADRFLVPTTEIEYVWQSHLLRYSSVPSPSPTNRPPR